MSVKARANAMWRCLPWKSGFRVFQRVVKACLPPALLLCFLLATAAQAQRFIPFVGDGLGTPDSLGLTPDAPPPDLDEPQIGEDPETAPFAAGQAAETTAPPSSGKSVSGKSVAGRSARIFFHGQKHDAFAPLTLGQRLRRALRDSPLGGGHDLWFQRRSPRTVYFLAFESSAHDRFASLGAKHAVRGTLDAPGLRFLSTLGVKITAFDPTQQARTSHVDTARMMPGYEMRAGSLTLSAFAGLGYARTSSASIPATGQIGRFGVSALGEFWQDWSRMAPALGRFTSGYIMLDSANRSAAAGLRHGFARAPFPFVIGPEASWSAGRDVRSRGASLHSAYRKGRLGVHASEIPLFAARLRISAGAEWRTRDKPGGYAEITAYLAY